MKNICQVGIDVLVNLQPEVLEGQRIGLIAHAASMDNQGIPSAQAIEKAVPGALKKILSPEHGYHSEAGPGDLVDDSTDTALNIPILSLYGETRKPSPEMLADLDLLVFDLHDLGFRCYTYVSTLRYVMEAASEAGLPLLVADRPIPLPNCVDGPMLDPKQESFVGMIPSPLSYGLTPGETALWLADQLDLDLELSIYPMQHYKREPGAQLEGLQWIPPSPGIKNWSCSYAYLATVFTEGLPQIRCARNTDKAFQHIAIEKLDAEALTTSLTDAQLPGFEFKAAEGGVDIIVTHPERIQPVSTSLYILQALQQQFPELWEHPEARPEFFDQLYGTSKTREALQQGTPPETIIEEWNISCADFLTERTNYLLYAS